MNVTVTETRLAAGDELALGDEILATDTEVPRGGGLKIICAHRGETNPCVVHRFHADGEIELPDDSRVLSVESGQGYASAAVWAVVPRDAYGGGE